MDYLVFRLYGAMASWGEIAVGESRHTANHPSKSAILGLIASALGIKREQEEKQLALANGYHIAIKQLTSGDLLKDYHTTQAPDSVGKCNYHTRRDELITGQDRLGTILSSREYRTDSVCLVALTPLANAPVGLLQIREKLIKPEFHLYLGRKSCPLAAPLDPQVVTGLGVKAALDSYDMKTILPGKKDHNRDQYWFGLSDFVQYYWEGNVNDLADDLELSAVQTVTRHDQVSSRKRWQFKPRLEHFYQCKQARENN